MGDPIIAPGGTMGILGGGQLGRMMVLAAAELGLRAHVFAPSKDSPAFDVAAERTLASYDDEAALLRFAQNVDVVTFEFENVPSAAARLLDKQSCLRPNSRTLSTTQDRLTEKTFLRDMRIPTAAFLAVSTKGELDQALLALGHPSVLKTRRFGYDGKGQVLIRPDEGSYEEALALVEKAPCILEAFVDFQFELSVVAARSVTGAFNAYDPCVNTHRHHILHLTEVPARLSPTTHAAALALTETIAKALDYVGILTVEMFLTREGETEKLVVNEIAPRVHNSGHWTIEGSLTSQFEQHVRAICGWPLGATTRLGRIEMRNLIGKEAEAWREILSETGAHLHLYGKEEARPGRKMGHVTRVFSEGPTATFPSAVKE